MMRYLLVCLLLGCPKPAPEPQKPKTQTELGRLMKQQVNAPFSKLTFLVFHGEDQEDAAAVKTALQSHVAVLRNAISKLLVWQHPPTESAEGKEVFFTYVSSIDKTAQQLEREIASDDMPAAARSLDKIAQVCNSCHHFFRLDIKDSVVGPNVPAP